MTSQTSYYFNGQAQTHSQNVLFLQNSQQTVAIIKFLTELLLMQTTDSFKFVQIKGKKSFLVVQKIIEWLFTNLLLR